MNKLAMAVNTKLGIAIYNTNVEGLVLNFFTKQQIKVEHIDDLIDVDTRQATDRLNDYTRDIMNELGIDSIWG